MDGWWELQLLISPNTFIDLTQVYTHRVVLNALGEGLEGRQFGESHHGLGLRGFQALHLGQVHVPHYTLSTPQQVLELCLVRRLTETGMIVMVTISSLYEAGIIIVWQHFHATTKCGNYAIQVVRHGMYLLRLFKNIHIYIYYKLWKIIIGKNYMLRRNNK